MPKRPEYAGAWPRIRLAILKRDSYLCQIHGPRCTVTATHVDHIIPVTKGGSWWDTSNLRASCQMCNLSRVDHTHNDRWLTGKTRIVLVIGPPNAGKYRYVQDHRGMADLVVEYDALSQALGGGTHVSTMVARNAVLTALRRGELDV